MSDNIKKKDLRIIKTESALINALLTLLNSRNFENITVNNICEEALISRATFYSYFCDKYDLLKYSLIKVSKEIKLTYQEMEAVNQLIYDNSKIITNIVENANDETLALLQSLMLSVLDAFRDHKKNSPMSPNQIALSNFCAGGMISLLQWQVKNRFSEKTPLITPYFFDMLKSIMEWDAKQAD